MARVVVVGGTEESRLLLRGLVKLFRHQIIGEASTVDALQGLSINGDPTVAIIDLDLDDAPASDALRATLRAHPLLRAILITSHRTAQAETRARALGFESLVRRPFAVHELMEAIDHLPPAPSAGDPHP